MEKTGVLVLQGLICEEVSGGTQECMLRAALSLGLSRKAGWIPGVTQRELCACSSAFCPLERACKLLTHSPPPCSVELLLFLSGAFVDSTVNREICVLKERVVS